MKRIEEIRRPSSPRNVEAGKAYNNAQIKEGFFPLCLHFPLEQKVSVWEDKEDETINCDLLNVNEDEKSIKVLQMDLCLSLGAQGWIAVAPRTGVHLQISLLAINQCHSFWPLLTESGSAATRNGTNFIKRQLQFHSYSDSDSRTKSGWLNICLPSVNRFIS